jgi:hypothetical protein
MRFPTAALCLLLLLTPAPPATAAAPQISAADRSAKLDVIRADIREQLPLLEKQIRDHKNMSVRQITNAALAALVVNGDVRQAEFFLRAALSTQVVDRNAPDYGNIPWDFSPSSNVHDDNSVAFTAEPLGPLLELYGDRLGHGTRDLLVDRAQGMFAELDRHTVKISYTNIFIMQATDLVMLGEAVHDQRAADDGYAKFQAWLDYTAKAGIGEFDSPTYYGVDFDVLYLGYRFCRKPGCQALYGRALDYFWREIEANLYRHTILSGPHSRDYDFLRGNGMLYQYLAMEEPSIPMSAHAIDPNTFARAYMIIACDEKGYRPSPEILALGDGDRVVRQRFSEDAPPRYNYVTHDFAIGNASANGGDQDKIVSVNLGEPTLPNITVFFDRHDSPYGVQAYADADGHMKPEHMALSPLGVQDQGTLLELFDPNPSKSTPSATLATDVILPVDATIVTQDGPIHVTRGMDLPLKAGAVVGVRAENGAVVIRPLIVDDLNGVAPRFELKADPDGFSKGALRLAIYNYKGDVQQQHAEHLRMAFLIVAAHAGSDDDLAALTQRVASAPLTSSIEDGVWRVQASYGGHVFVAARDAATRAIVTNTVDGREPSNDLFSVNGMVYPF